MSIGFYGGMANNMYVFASRMAEIGRRVLYIRDRTDRYIMSQPAWEDVRATVAYEDLAATTRWSWERYANWERSHGWKAPAWMGDPVLEPSGAASMKLSGMLARAYGAHSSSYWPEIVAAMGACEALIVCGVEGTILAGLAGRPFVIMPHGGDIRIAAGLARMGTPKNMLEKHFGTPGERLLRNGYEKAKAVITDGPLKYGGPTDPNYRSMDAYLRNVRFERVSVPMQVHERHDATTRRALLDSLLAELGLEPVRERLVAFVPSRIDYYWKGHDRLIPTLREMRGSSELHVIFSGWGNDYANLKEALQGCPATFLPYALSKQLLYDFFLASDFVIDQFVVGHCGTACEEAMACAAPVLMWLDPKEFEGKDWEMPPVLNARTPEEVAAVLRQIVAGEIDLDAVSVRTTAWARLHHGPENMSARLMQVLKS